MNSNHPALDRFLNVWLTEFSRAIETVTGQQPDLKFSRTDTVSIPQTASALWLKQVLSGESEFEIWIGAEEATWTELGTSSGDGTPDGLRSTYLELVKEAQQKAAASISAELPTAVRCGTAETSSAADFEPVSFFICDLEFIDKDRSPIVVAVEKKALKVLEPALQRKAENALAVSNSKNVATSDFRRIASLSLPVSVSLGSARLELNKVLQARAGSVISLAKDTSDLMELLVDGVIVARGELVVVKGNYGFRVKQIVTQSQRISLYSN